MSTALVREATLGDVGALLDMMEDFNTFEQIAWSRSAGEPALRKLLSDPALGLVGLVEEGGTTHGYFVLTWGFDLEWNGRDAFLTELFLVAAARGRGLGRMALRRAEELARLRGARALHLLVRPENRVARELYSGEGFVSPARVFLTKSLDEIG